MTTHVVADAQGRVVQVVPVADCALQAFPQWTTRGYILELREIYAAVSDRYSRPRSRVEATSTNAVNSPPSFRR
jgi:hypothetical protein